MNAEILLRHFDRISEAPDAIPHLRRFILDLAVRGKLVEQDPNDEPAGELLKRIRVEKARLVKTGKGIMLDNLPSVRHNEELFTIPESWLWIRIGIAAFVEMGQSPPSEYYNQSGDGVPFFQGKADFGIRHPKARYWCTQPTKYAYAGDILISVRAPVGPTNVANETCCIGRGLAALRPYPGINSEFLLKSLKCFEPYLETIGFGTTFVAINKKQLISFPIPLPPLAEQHRIVAKVDELMALCDQLEAARNEREARRDRLVAASLHRIGTTTADEAKNAACFHLDHLSRLTTRPEHIKQLRQTILNLAVRGRLVPQDPNDEPVVILLKQIGAKSSDDAPFSIPDSWNWITVGQIGDTRLGKMLDKAKNKGTPRRYLRNVNVRWLDFDLSDVYEMPFEDDELDEFALRRGDILICEGGEPGRAAVWDEREKGIYFQKAIHRLRFEEGVNPHFFVKALRESADSGRLSSYFTGVGIKHFTGKGLASFVFPLPPLAEQHRIVAKVDELMALCDQLETQLTTTETDSRRLLEAVLQKALAPVLEDAD